MSNLQNHVPTRCVSQAIPEVLPIQCVRNCSIFLQMLLLPPPPPLPLVTNSRTILPLGCPGQHPQITTDSCPTLTPPLDQSPNRVDFIAKEFLESVPNPPHLLPVS